MDAFVDPDVDLLRTAIALYALRRKRDFVVAGRGIFGEPAWDILLDLYIADRRRTDVQVSSVCLDAGVASTTMLRWLARLEAENLIFRTADTSDARRRYVRLTEEGRNLMREILRSMSTTGLN